MVVAPHDRVAPGELSLHAYESAAHPKKLVTIPGGHFDAYRGHAANIAQIAARDWFRRAPHQGFNPPHLAPRRLDNLIENHCDTG
jgi:hypothetical protein